MSIFTHIAYVSIFTPYNLNDVKRAVKLGKSFGWWKVVFKADMVLMVLDGVLCCAGGSVLSQDLRSDLEISGWSVCPEMLALWCSLQEEQLFYQSENVFQVQLLGIDGI